MRYAPGSTHSLSRKQTTARPEGATQVWFLRSKARPDLFAERVIIRLARAGFSTITPCAGEEWSGTPSVVSYWQRGRNPSDGYVGRVAAVFANNGLNIRGDMRAVVKAILLDPEARAGDTAVVPGASDGHLKEPADLLLAINPWAQDRLFHPR